MPIEIRELVIKVKIEETLSKNNNSNIDVSQIKQSILKECKKEISKQINQKKER